MVIKKIKEPLYPYKKLKEVSESNKKPEELKKIIVEWGGIKYLPKDTGH